MGMPLSLLRTGESSLITRIGGKPETRQFLEGLGFVVGTPVTVAPRKHRLSNTVQRTCYEGSTCNEPERGPRGGDRQGGQGPR